MTSCEREQKTFIKTRVRANEIDENIDNSNRNEISPLTLG